MSSTARVISNCNTDPNMIKNFKLPCRVRKIKSSERTRRVFVRSVKPLTLVGGWWQGVTFYIVGSCCVFSPVPKSKCHYWTTEENSVKHLPITQSLGGDRPRVTGVKYGILVWVAKNLSSERFKVSSDLRFWTFNPIFGR